MDSENKIHLTNLVNDLVSSLLAGNNSHIEMVINQITLHDWQEVYNLLEYQFNNYTANGLSEDVLTRWRSHVLTVAERVYLRQINETDCQNVLDGKPCQYYINRVRS